MTLAQRFAQIFGAIYLLVGIIGFIPPLLIGSVPGAIALFAVNWFHSLAHLLIGAAGLASYRNANSASAYALALGVAYTLLFVVGLIWGIRFLGGLLALNGWNHILHLLTALVAFGAYFGSRRDIASSTT